jgi:hypothetical protein
MMDLFLNRSLLNKELVPNTPGSFTPFRMTHKRRIVMTIKVTVLSGPYAGRTEEVLPDISARNLLGDFLIKRWGWSVDYSAATEDEAFEWGRQDLSVRIIRALGRGLPVTFLEKIHRVVDTTNAVAFERIVGEVEDAIASSGRIVSLDYDDARGVGVADLGPVQ